MRAKPQFPGHYQPHLPGELGYYDLRVPEVREAQAELAREHGIHGFVYYHYWFNGRRLLERPFDEVLQSGSPDFPFALCWANEEWTRNWDALTGKVIMYQEYSEEDDLAHIRWLATAFQDDRYIKVDGRPLMLVYRAEELADPKRTFAIWRDEAKKLGIPDLYLCYVESHGPPRGGPAAYGMDASVRFMPIQDEQVHVIAPAGSTRGLHVIDYPATAKNHLDRPRPDWKQFPSVMVSWDNTARRRSGATVYAGATPQAYEHCLRETVASVAEVPEEENFVFLLAWNEWAEGNHLEPDQQFGRAWLEATRSVMVGDVPDGEPWHPSGDSSFPAHDEGELLHDYIYDIQHQSAAANAAGLIRDLVPDRSSTVVDINAGSGFIGHALQDLGIGYHGLERRPAAVEAMRERGISASQCDLSDVHHVVASLGGVDHVGALLLLDVLQQLQDPQELLSALSTWAMDHGEPTLVASAPNVAHFDVGLRLICGRWIPTESGLLDSSHIRFFTAETLANLFERTGWELVARADYLDLRSDQYDPRLTNLMTVETIGILRVLSATINPNASVNQYVWALRPVGVTHPPSSYLDAIGLTESQRNEEPSGDLRAVDNYLASVDLLAGEENRRSTEGGYGAAQSGRANSRSGSGWLSLAHSKQTAARGAGKPPEVPGSPSGSAAGFADPSMTTMPTGPWVLVIGCHRSGTSAVTGALVALGLHGVDPADRADPLDSIPQRWESRSVAEFDDHLLTRLGGAWDAPPADAAEALLPSSPSGAQGLDPAGIMAAAYPESGPLVWKDPRACLLLPYWRAVLPEPLTAVFVWRDPLATAQALHHRDGIPLADGLALWEHYNRSAAIGLRGIDTYVLDYASAVADPRKSLGGVSDWLSGIDRFASWVDTWDHDAAARAIDEGLRHQTAGADPDDGALPVDQQVVAEWLRSVAGAHTPLKTSPPGPLSLWPEALVASRRAQLAWNRTIRLNEIRREREIDTVRHLLDDERLRLEGSRRELERMRASTSWKVTAPLRSLMAKLSL